jgi:UDPglucose 6-dehydrogenase
VLDDDASDLSLLETALAAVSPFLPASAIVVVSSQLPVGTARIFRQRLQERDPSVELVYSPENLRLGEAIECYLRPGHVIIGSDSDDAGRSVAELFGVLDAEMLLMALPAAEMAKHCINSFLATSVALANQWADICASYGADYFTVADAIKRDPRIGPRAYLSPGLGFSGGTLGRDLQALSAAGYAAGVDAPLFGEVWRYNASRREIVGAMAERALGSIEGKTICFLGMTYKAGTSTLRRSVALEVAGDLARRGAQLRGYDPMADWSSALVPSQLTVAHNAYDAADGCDILVLLTEWPEFRALDYDRILSNMRGTTLIDTKGLLLSRAEELESLGFNLLFFGRPLASPRFMDG